VLGTPALFATAYGNVGSSIYYALGLTAAFALGLTPIVFIIAGVIFAATAATYAEGTVRYPEAGGSSSFARHAFNELVSFGAGWTQMLVYVVTIATSAFFVPHYLSIFWEPLRKNPWDVVGGIVVIAILVIINIIDEAWAIGDSYGVKVVGRLARGRHTGRAIIEEAVHRNTEIIVVGAARQSEALRRSIFGDTVDYVLKHAPCRVMVVSAKARAA